MRDSEHVCLFLISITSFKPFGPKAMIMLTFDTCHRNNSFWKLIRVCFVTDLSHYGKLESVFPQ